MRPTRLYGIMAKESPAGATFFAQREPRRGDILCTTKAPQGRHNTAQGVSPVYGDIPHSPSLPCADGAWEGGFL